MAGVTLLRKMSSKSIGFGKTELRKLAEEANKATPGAVVWLYTIGGIAQRVERGESTNGPWTAFKGDFAAKTIIGNDGKPTVNSFRSPKCFINEPMSGMLESAVERKTGEGVEYNDVQFACRVGVVAADTATGYEYRVEPIVKMVDSDPLAALIEKMDTDVQALPAPKPEPEKQPAKAPEKGKGK